MGSVWLKGRKEAASKAEKTRIAVRSVEIRSRMKLTKAASKRPRTKRISHESMRGRESITGRKPNQKAPEPEAGCCGQAGRRKFPNRLFAKRILFVRKTAYLLGQETLYDINMKTFLLIPLVTLGGFVASEVAAQNLLYLETFNHGGDSPELASGWAGGFGATNTDTTLRPANWYDDAPGKREISEGVNNHQLAVHTDAGTIVQSTDPAWVQFYTTEYTEGTEFAELGRIEFDVLNLERLRDYHITVQAGGDWFISLETITAPNFDQVWHTQQGLDLGSVSWYAAPDGFAGVGKDPGLFSESDIDALAEVVPSGTVGGFGFVYYKFGTGNVVVDNYSVYAVPEPSVYGLMGGLLALGLVMVRRRKR